MSMRECLLSAVERGLAKKDKAEEILKTYDDLVEGHINAGKSPIEANDLASADALAFVEAKTAGDKRKKIKTAQKQAELREQVINTLDSDGNPAPDHALTNIIEDLDARIDSVRGLLHNSVNKFLEKHGYKGFGIKRERAGLTNMLKAMFNEPATPASKALAKSLKDMSELRVMLLRDAGLNVVNDPNWRLPQNHSRGLLRSAGEEVWVTHHMTDGVLDWDKMKDYNNNLPIQGAAKKREVLTIAFSNIITDGAATMTPGGKVNASLSTRLERPRVLHYASSKSWLDAMGKYGEGDMFEQIVMHIETSATDIAMVQKLGPNAKAGLEFAFQTAKSYAADVNPSAVGAPRNKNIAALGNKKALGDRVNGLEQNINDAFSILSGANAMTEQSILGRQAAGTRNIMISSLLGSTPAVSIVSDAITSSIAKHRNGLMSQNLVARTFKQYNPFNGADRKIGMSSGLVLETLISRGNAVKRFTGDTMAPGWTRVVSDVTTRASALQQTTRSAKWAMGMEFQSALAANSKVPLNKLNPSLKKSMERNGITSADWDVIRQTKVYDPTGYNQLRPVDIIKRTDIPDSERIRLFNLASDMMNKIILEAVPEATTLSSVALGKAMKKGTVRGEISQMGGMLKSFPVAIYYIHLQKYYRENPGYLPAYVIGTGGAGVLALQLGALASGKDFYDMSNPGTIGAGLLKGGGMGILGDFLFSNLNRFGGGLADTLAGPFFGLASDTTNLTLGNLKEMLQGKDTNLTGEALEFLNSWMPGTRTWYLKLLKERLIVDQIRMEVDPQARSKMIRRERKMKKEENRSSWWLPGTDAPQRGPSFETQGDYFETLFD